MTSDVSPRLRDARRLQWWMKTLRGIGVIGGAEEEDIKLVTEFQGYFDQLPVLEQALFAQYMTNSLIDAIYFLMRMDVSAPDPRR